MQSYNLLRRLLPIKSKCLLSGAYKNINFVRKLHEYKIDFSSRCLCSVTQPRQLQKQTMRPKNIANVDDLLEYINDGNYFYLKLLLNIYNHIDFNDLNEQQAVFLLECCGNSVVDSSQQQRNDVCQSIFKKLLTHKKLSIDVFHTYIKICTQNSVVLDVNEFLSFMKEVPNNDTYKSLLENVCSHGDINQAYQILKIMKDNNIAIDESIFNLLVFAHTLQGGLTAGLTVLQTMKTAQISATSNTKFMIYKALCLGDYFEEFTLALSKYPIEFTEDHFLQIIEDIGLRGNHAWLPKIVEIYSKNRITRDTTKKLQNICIHLVHMDKSETAMEIYKTFVDPQLDEKYGFILLKEMLHKAVPIEQILTIGKKLRDTGLNEYALEQVTELALRHGYKDPALYLLKSLSNVKPHFLWPLLITAHKENGELGVIEVVQEAHKMNVKFDYETLTSYVFPFCNLKNVNLILKQLQELNYTIKELLSPLIVVLLANNKTKIAVNLCSSYKVQLHGQQLLNNLSTAWHFTKDTKSIVLLLQKYCETNKSENDLVGEFLIKCMKFCKKQHDYDCFLQLLKVIHQKRLRINTSSSEALDNIVDNNMVNPELLSDIKNTIESLLDFNMKLESNYIPHPRDMNLNQLESHLIELQEKGMQTRGVLRKLIQLHCNDGNISRVNELRNQFLSAGYKESAGMMSNLMYILAQKNNLDEALNLYNTLKSEHPQFKLDDFKLIDLASLMVKHSRYKEAIDLLTNGLDIGRKFQKQQLEKNCWRLLESYEDEIEQTKMFNFLIQNGICDPTNNILGRLIKLQLNKRNISTAVKQYEDFVTKYKCTPLQFELICDTLDHEDKQLCQRTLDATEKVHGNVVTQAALVTALAEKQLDGPLRKSLLSMKHPIKNYVTNKCDRWVKEGKLEALTTLLKNSDKISNDILDVPHIYRCILQICYVRKDCETALALYNKLVEDEALITKEFETELQDLLKFCNHPSLKQKDMNI